MANEDAAKVRNENEGDDFFGRTVELSNGKKVIIDAWGIAEVGKNFSTLQRLVMDLMNQDESPEEVKNDPEARSRFIATQMNRLVSLIEDSIVGGDIAFKDIKGLNNIISVVEAVIEVNELFDAMGKVMNLVVKAMNRMKTGVQTISQISEEKTT